MAACALSAVGLYVYWRWNSLSYLWFDLPAAREALSTVPGVAILQVEDLGPDDERFYMVTLGIEGKGQLVVSNLTRAMVLDQQSVGVFGIRDCRFIPSPEHALPPMYLSKAISGYEELFELVRERGLCP